MGCRKSLCQAGKFTQWLEAYGQLEKLKNDGRLKLCCAKALVALEQYDAATQYLNYDLRMPDIKEGDTAISDVWFRLYEKLVFRETGITDPETLRKVTQEHYPLKNLDFRTH